jgi:hypothetical protein
MTSVLSGRRFAAHFLHRPLMSGSGAAPPQVTQASRIAMSVRDCPNSELTYESKWYSQFVSAAFRVISVK